MKLFKISQTVNGGYDTYDSVVVCAEDEEAARRIHPMGENNTYFLDEEDTWMLRLIKGGVVPYGGGERAWALPKDVIVEYLGEAQGWKHGVIVASFNAG
jgi:hypothetical protein